METVFDELPPFKAGKYLTFRVARHDFAMSAAVIRGILPTHQMVALEIPHPWLCGFASIGGRDFPVVDLRAKLGFVPGSRGREPLIIAVAVGTSERIAGFIADRVSEVVEVRQRDFRHGAVRSHGRARRVLDPEQIMQEEDWRALRICAITP